MIVGEPKWTWRGWDGSNFDPGGYCTWGFCNFLFNFGMGLLDFPGLGFAGCVHGWYASEGDVLSEILRVHDRW